MRNRETISSEKHSLCCCTYCRVELTGEEDLGEHYKQHLAVEDEHEEDILDEFAQDDATVKRPAIQPTKRSEEDIRVDESTQPYVPVVVATPASRARITRPLGESMPITPQPPVLSVEIPTTDPITPIPLAIDDDENDLLASSESSVPSALPTIEPVTPLPAIEQTKDETRPEVLAVPSLAASPLERETQAVQSRPWQRVQSLLTHVPLWTLIVAAGLLTMLVQGFRLGSAPDIFSDEGVYFLVAANIAQGHGLIADHTGFFWHPPTFMLIEALYLKLAGLTYADPLTGVLAARFINIFLAGCTTVMLILLGRKLHSYKAGFMIALFFLLDPYVQRINRRNMLETLAMLAILIGLYCFFTLQPRVGRWGRVGAGIAFGVAALTKEAMFLELFALILYVAWCRRGQVRDLFWVIGIACGVYLLYPLWAFVAGQWNNYVAYKLFGIDRIIARIQDAQKTPTSSTITLVGSSRGDLVDAIVARLAQYGMSYALIALAAVLSIVLILRFRHVATAQYLAVWNIFSVGFGFVLGGVSDQYFYYLIVSSICVVGYTATILLEGGSSTYSKAMLLRVPGWLQRFSSIYSFLFRLLWRPLLAVLAIMLLVNTVTWTRTYALGSDDAYMSIVRYIKTHFPRGETIEASDDVAYYYLSPAYTIRLDRDPTTIQNMQVHYFIMSSKDAQGGYDDMTPELYNWVIQHSHPLFVQNDLSFAKIGLYQLDTTSSVTPNPSAGIGKTMRFPYTGEPSTQWLAYVDKKEGIVW